MEIEKEKIESKVISLVLRVISIITMLVYFAVSCFGTSDGFISKQSSFYVMLGGLAIMLIDRVIKFFYMYKNSNSVYEKYAGLTMIAIFVIATILFYFFRG